MVTWLNRADGYGRAPSEVHGATGGATLRRAAVSASHLDSNQRHAQAYAAYQQQLQARSMHSGMLHRLSGITDSVPGPKKPYDTYSDLKTYRPCNIGSGEWEPLSNAGCAAPAADAHVPFSLFLC